MRPPTVSPRWVWGASAVVVTGAALSTVVALTGPDPGVPQESAPVLGVRLAGPVAAGQPVLRARAVPNLLPRPAGRNPFLMPTPPTEAAIVSAPTAGLVSGAPPGGRNPFLPLVATVVPETPAARTADPTSPAPIALLRRGSTGDGVRTLQQQLRDHDWNVVVDGVLGPQTESAVRAFQRRRGLADDGLVGPLTRAALRQGG